MEIFELPEEVLHFKLIEYFGKWFDVTFEVYSDCRKARIDILMYHNSDFLREFPIGIEVKGIGMKRGVEIGEWCAQANRYTKVTFDEGKTATIFTAPQISGYYLDEGAKVKKHNVLAHGYPGSQHNVNPFLYRSFGIGELQKYKEGYGDYKRDCYRLVINTYIVWTSSQPLQFNFHKMQAL